MPKAQTILKFKQYEPSIYSAVEMDVKF